MNQVFKYIREFYQKEFNLWYFLLILLLVGTLIYVNYWHFLERRYAANAKTKWAGFAGYYLLYFIPFATAFFLQLLFFKDCTYYNHPWFWVILILAPAFFSFRVNFDFHEAIINKIWTGDELQFWLRCINWVVRVLVLLVPVFIIWFIKDKNTQPFYGTKALDDIKPYLIMLLIMIPLLALASTQKDFLSMYPKAKFLTWLETGHQKWRYVVYELCYGFDFVSIEFFFRGFLILSLLKICGTHSIIPVACFYCTIHLGKPMGEAISSFWGGLLLGVVSYNTGSVWGGLIVHLGIAWFMEIGGWLGALFRK
ncbi:CPBP family intramembrane glutamic endopeptidase [Ferruginibacter sp. SUN106]|uniref:CPBP family intramembrane glutamic endopeptidase n=1 Tax=Ferruginibacter sp. SUN106 TaxID=2978348 RepID=UPI003D367F00